MPRGKPTAGFRKKKVVRAGKRNCRRCKETWNRERGDKSTICTACQGRCSRCNVDLTEENTSVCTQRKGAYRCKDCVTEGTKLTEGNAGGDRRDNYLVKKYGITLPEYEVMLAMQGGVCWICQQPPKVDAKDGRRVLHVDHRHVKNDKRQNPRNTRTRIRGLLCWRCNASLQKFKDDPVLMRKAADYVEQCPAQDYLKEIEHGN